MTRVNQFLAQNRVANMATPTMTPTIFEARMLNPANIIKDPQNAEPKYPAGRVKAWIPPRILVTPPSSGFTSIPSIFAPVQTPTEA